MKDLIQSIIKEYVEPYPGTIRKSNSPVGYGNNKEMLDKFYRVSKIEENEALNFIRNRMMIYIVGLFKQQYSRISTSKGEQGELTDEIVNKRLKKISDDRHPGQRNKDIIQYSAPLIKNYILTINIFKNSDGELAIGYNNSLNKEVKYFLVNGPERLTPMYEVEAPIPAGGYGKHGIPLWSDEEKYQHFYRISKKEANEVLAYIKRIIVPMFLDKYNKWVVEGDRVSSDQVNANLKMIRQETYPISAHNRIKHDLVVWKSDIKVSNEGIANFIFFAFKFYANKLYVGVRSPISAGIEVFAAHTNPPHKVDFDIRLSQHPQFFKESVEIDWHILFYLIESSIRIQMMVLLIPLLKIK